MTFPRTVRARVLTQLPSRVIGGTAIKVTKDAGDYVFDLDLTELAVQPGPITPANHQFLTYEKTTGAARRIEASDALLANVVLASQAEAIAGTANDRLMTPLRVDQAAQHATFDATATTGTMPAPPTIRERAFLAQPHATDWGARPGATGIGAKLNKCVADMGAEGGGTVQFEDGTYVIDAPVNNNVHGVLFRGARATRWFSFGTFQPATYFVAGGPMAYMVRHGTTYGVSAQTTTGGGIDNIAFNANNLASRAVEIDSTRHGTYRFFATAATGDACVAFKTGRTGIDGPEAMDVQRADIDIVVDQAGSPHAVLWDTTPEANVSKNFNIRMLLRHQNGDALHAKSGDHNTFAAFSAFLVPSGTGRSLYAGARNTAAPSPWTPPQLPTGFEGNEFYYFANAAPVVFEDPSAFLSGNSFVSNVFWWDSQLGGAQPPQLAFPTRLLTIVRSTTGFDNGGVRTSLPIGGNTADAVQALLKHDALASVFAYNGSNRHFILEGPEIAGVRQTWRVFVDATTGNLAFERLNGSGRMILPATTTSLGTGAITTGAADSGGTGFRVLRVPN